MRRVEAAPSACILAAFLLLTLPLRWLLAALFAAGIHELCHALAVRLCGGRIFRIRVGPSGAAMETDGLSFPREMLCALAGPMGSFLLLTLGKWFPEAAICGAVQGMYNLLPVYPLDGGRALRCFLGMVLPEQVGERIARMTGRAVTAALLGVLVYLLIRLDAWPIAAILLAFGLIGAALRKIACKEDHLAVQ